MSLWSRTLFFIVSICLSSLPAHAQYQVRGGIADMFREQSEGKDPGGELIEQLSKKKDPIGELQFGPAPAQRPAPKKLPPIKAQDLALDGKCDSMANEESSLKDSGARGGFVSKIIASAANIPFQIPDKCIIGAMKQNYWRQGHHPSRPGQEPKPRFQTCSDEFKVPCVTPTYVKAAKASLSLALYCMKGYGLGAPTKTWSKVEQQRVRTWMAIFKHESGFHTSAKSPTGPHGFTQLADAAVTTVNKNVLTEAKQYLQNHPDRNCQNMLEALSPHLPLKKGCSRGDSAGANPLINIFYAIAHLKFNEGVLKKREGGAIRAGLDAEGSARMLSYQAAWAHNSGAGGHNTVMTMLEPPVKIEEVILSSPRLKRTFDERILTLRERSETLPAKYKEVANYMISSEDEFAHMEKHTGPCTTFKGLSQAPGGAAPGTGTP